MKKSLIVAISWLLVGCGKSVDLGGAERWYDAGNQSADSSAPRTLYEGHSWVLGLAVDDSTLYALLWNSAKQEQRLLGCPADRCQSESFTLFEGPAGDPWDGNAPSPLRQAKGKLCWVARTASLSGIACCSTKGCPQGPTWLHETASPDEVTAFANDGDFTFWLDDGSQSVQRRAFDGKPAERIYQHDSGSFFSWPSRIAEYGDYLYLSDGALVFRIRKDGSGAAELVVRELNIADVSVAAGGVYFTTSLLTGAIAHCPLEGCASAPQALVRNQRWPKTLQVDATSAFWLMEMPAPAEEVPVMTLLGCELSAPNEAHTLASGLVFRTPLSHAGSNAVLVVNRQSVFWVEDDEGYGSRIRRLSR